MNHYTFINIVILFLLINICIIFPKLINQPKTINKLKPISKSKTINKLKPISKSKTINKLKPISKSKTINKLKSISKSKTINKLKPISKSKTINKLKSISKSDILQPLKYITVDEWNKYKLDQNLQFNKLNKIKDKIDTYIDELQTNIIKIKSNDNKLDNTNELSNNEKAIKIAKLISKLRGGPGAILMEILTKILEETLNLDPKDYNSCPNGWFDLDNIPETVKVTIKNIPFLGNIFDLLGNKLCITTKICSPNTQEYNGLCYPYCLKDYKGIGPLCWKSCPDNWTDIGYTCFDKKNLKNKLKQVYDRGIGEPKLTIKMKELKPGIKLSKY